MDNDGYVEEENDFDYLSELDDDVVDNDDNNSLSDKGFHLSSKKRKLNDMQLFDTSDSEEGFGLPPDPSTVLFSPSVSQFGATTTATPTTTTTTTASSSSFDIPSVGTSISTVSSSLMSSSSEQGNNDTNNNNTPSSAQDEHNTPSNKKKRCNCEPQYPIKAHSHNRNVMIGICGTCRRGTITITPSPDTTDASLGATDPSLHKINLSLCKPYFINISDKERVDIGNVIRDHDVNGLLTSHTMQYFLKTRFKTLKVKKENGLAFKDAVVKYDEILGFCLDDFKEMDWIDERNQAPL
jgi:hypothetical protein